MVIILLQLVLLVLTYWCKFNCYFIRYYLHPITEETTEQLELINELLELAQEDLATEIRLVRRNTI